MDRKKILGVASDYLMIIFGCLCYTLGWLIFMIPYNMSSGGLTGACVILNYGTGIPVSASYLVINVVLLILGTIILGKGFGFKTVFAILLCTAIFDVGPKLDFLNPMTHDWLRMHEMILNPVIGGLMEALGLSIIFRHGGSTGGTDIIALILNKYWPVTPGIVYLVTDTVIIASMLLIPGKGLQDVAYGYIMMITFSLAVDAFTYWDKSTAQVMIFSNKYTDIADHINKVMHRGVTALNGIGWYTKDERKVLLIFIRKNQIGDMTKEIKTVDPNAFVAVSPTSSVFGEGFEVMKTGIERKPKKK